MVSKMKNNKFAYKCFNLNNSFTNEIKNKETINFNTRVSTKSIILKIDISKHEEDMNLKNKKALYK